MTNLAKMVTVIEGLVRSKQLTTIWYKMIIDL
jgi:hypothetical protein